MKKRTLNLLIIVIFTLIVLYFSLKDNYHEIITSILNADIRWLFISYLLVLGYTFLKAIVTNNIINNFKGYGIKKTFSLQLMTFFFNAVTPFSTGGQPFQVYVLKKNKLTLSEGTNVVIQESIIHQIAIIIVGFLTIIINQIFKICPIDGIIFVLLIVGFLANLLVLVLLFVVSYGKKIDKLLIGWVVNLLTFFKIVKDKEKQTKKLNKSIENFNVNARLLISNKKKFIKLILLNCLAFMCLYIVPLTVLFSLGNYNSFDGVTAIVLVSFASIISSYVPLPGGIGGQEYLFVTLFGFYLQKPLLSTLMLLWRFITYYLPMIVGAIIFNIKQKEI